MKKIALASFATIFLVSLVMATVAAILIFLIPFPCLDGCEDEHAIYRQVIEQVEKQPDSWNYLYSGMYHTDAGGNLVWVEFPNDVHIDGQTITGTAKDRWRALGIIYTALENEENRSMRTIRKTYKVEPILSP